MGLYVHFIRELAALQINRSLGGVYNKGYVGLWLASAQVGFGVEIAVILVPEERGVLTGAVITAVRGVLEQGGFTYPVTAVV